MPRLSTTATRLAIALEITFDAGAISLFVVMVAFWAMFCSPNF